MQSMMRRLRKSLAWRLRGVARTLGEPDDHSAWLAIDLAADQQRQSKPAPVEHGDPIIPGKSNGASIISDKPVVPPKPVSQDDVLRFCRKLAPFDVEGFAKTRLGNSNDGGYIFIDDFDEVSTVISCGISNDVTCDLAFADMGKEIVQFDHTVEGPPVSHRRFRFRKQAIDETLAIPGAARLSDVIGELGDRTRSDLLLKIDIEGSEWTTFANLPKSDLLRCRQIACEFHDSSKFAGREFFSVCEQAVATICDGFFPVHVHANNFRGFSTVAGVPLPDVFEVTFVNRAFYKQGARQKAGPLAIDAPNNADAPDLFLGSPFSLAGN
jgi:hypothetical protein